MSKSRTSPEAGHAPRLLVILTAPSGTGKTTVASLVLGAEPRLAFSVSHTTRPARGEEKTGVEYHFVDDDTFDAMVAKGAFAEWAHVHARRYGTSHGEIRRLGEAGFDILFDIDPQGGRQLMAAYPEAVTVFLVPPSMEALEERLRGRGTDSDEQVAVRLAAARLEMVAMSEYAYVIVNDTVDDAVEQFAAILRAERLRTHRRSALVETLTQVLGHDVEDR